MIRKKISRRTNWIQKVEQLGFSFHSIDDKTYWDESTCYEFSYKQISIIENASNEIYKLFLETIDHIITHQKFDDFLIPEEYIPYIKKSWYNDHPSIYGRFDLSWDGNIHHHPKLLEFNADTPTSLFEASVVQWFWLSDFNKNFDQFNSIHEKLIESWKDITQIIDGDTIHFSCIENSEEDDVNTNYLRDCAIQAGIKTQFLKVSDIGFNGFFFTDMNENNIKNIFKLYPWEWMINESFGKHLLQTETLWIEPPWKMLLSNKAILPYLWKLFPNHPNLLETYFDTPNEMKNYAVKPLFSREGANVQLFENSEIILKTDGEYGEEGFIYQELCRLPEFDGNFPVIGSWIIGGESAGIGIRESSSLITDNLSRFVPHYIYK